MKSPLSTIELPIRWNGVRAADVVPEVRAAVRAAEAALDALAHAAPTWDATMAALDMATERLDWTLGLASHLESVCGEPEIRAAYAEAQEISMATYTRLVTDSGAFAAVKRFAATPEAAALTGARRRFLDKTLADFHKNGADLDDAKKAELTALDAELARLTLTFAQNVLDSTNAFELLVDDEARLAGLPARVVQGARASAADKGKRGFRLTLQAPCYLPVMTYLEDRGIREAMYRANVTRATAAPHDNAALIGRILEVRRKKATMLGFADFADLVTSDRMAGSGRRAKEFVAHVAEALRPAFARENAELEELARRHGVAELRPWDVAFFAEKLRAERYAFDEEALRPYFAAPQVLDGLFRIASALFDVRIEPADIETWHPTVTAFGVKDAANRDLGVFYMDLYPRESKRDGAWMAGLVDRLPGTRHERQNVALIVGNLTPGRDGTPPLFSHREVETVFHEFGHMMHHLLSRADIRSQAGTRVVADFVELPSKMMENWCWERESLALFAKHWETGAPLPEPLVDKMQRARTFRAANAMMRQLGFSSVDLAMHTEPDAGRFATPAAALEYARRTFVAFSPVALPDEYAMIASFSHLFGGAYSYAAGYYVYQWAEQLDAHAFLRFKEKGVLDGVTGARYRDEILARGDGDDPGALFRNFTGEEPRLEPMLARLGVG
ncbi:MAG: M3 family metallopeptidase [Myxococcales bacterium]|nr:M3 family metallopeptidase [Myxococcales bacterium]